VEAIGCADRVVADQQAAARLVASTIDVAHRREPQVEAASNRQNERYFDQSGTT
jgi:hypothetical protein